VQARDQEVDGRDYSQVPKEMDAGFEKLDKDNSVRPTIIQPATPWTKRMQKALLAETSTSMLGDEDVKKEKDAAFDLLDALTKSGALAVNHASLHVVIAATHCFDKTLTRCVVQDGINPIDKVERSTLIMAKTIHQQPTTALLREPHITRVRDVSPQLFEEDMLLQFDC